MAAVTTIPIVDGFATLNDDGTATLLTLAKVPTGQTRALTAPEAAFVAAVQAQTQTAAQDADVTALLTGAQALIDALRTKDTQYVTARTALATALNGTNLPASPTTAQFRTAILAIGTYLAVDHDAGRLIGADLILTVKALGNRIARDAGSSTVLT